MEGGSNQSEGFAERLVLVLVLGGLSILYACRFVGTRLIGIL